jgi:hypothetical protein
MGHSRGWLHVNSAQRRSDLALAPDPEAVELSGVLVAMGLFGCSIIRTKTSPEKANARAGIYSSPPSSQLKVTGACPERRAALCGPPCTSSVHLKAKLCNRALFDLRDTALVDAKFGSDFPTLPVEVVQERDHALFSR